jgi:hypothetical protein
MYPFINKSRLIDNQIQIVSNDYFKKISTGVG